MGRAGVAGKLRIVVSDATRTGRARCYRADLQMNHSRQRPSLLRATSLLAAANVLTIATGFLTGPIIARSIGADGRGLIAAILVPLSIASMLATFSAGDYANQSVARGAPAGRVTWSLLPMVLVTGAVTAGVVILLAPWLAAGESLVEDLLVVGALLLPLGLCVPMGLGVFSGKHRWTPVALALALPAAVNAVAIVFLAVTDALTVTTVAVASLTTGLLGVVPLLVVARGALRPVPVDWRIAREGSSYGVRSFPGVASVALNARLDQALMLSLAGARELGLYAIAVTIASASSSLVSSIGVATAPDVAAGDRTAAARSCRLAMTASILIGSGLAVAAYPLLRVLFGPEFTEAIDMVLILLVAQVPVAGSLVLGYSLRAVNRPGIVSWADIVALGVTVVGLVLLVPALGGVGAALVSLATYVVAFVLLLLAARSHFGLAVSDFLVADRAEVISIVRRLLAVGRRITPQGRRGQKGGDGR